MISRVVFSLYDACTVTKWKKLREDVRWRSTWSSGEFYLQGDLVVQSGSLYVATSNHTAQDDEEPGSGESWTSKWRLLAETATYDATGWVDKHAYTVNYFIIDDDDTAWLCVESHTSKAGVNEPGLYEDDTFLSGGDVSLTATKTYTYEHPGLPADEYPTWACTHDFQTNEWLYNLYCNTFPLTGEDIATAWDETNELRFLRKPLGFVQTRDSDLRWTMSGQQNIRVQLKRAVDEDPPRADVSKDLLEDGETKGSVSIADGTTNEIAGQVQARGLGKFHLKVSEVGTRSFAQYIDKEPGTGMTSGWDWLEPEGIFWCPFDTSDTTNFKVTKEPSYDADAVTTPIISVIGNRRIDLMLVPRTWAYYCRNWQRKRTWGGTVYCYDTTSPPPPDRVEWTVTNVLRKTQFAYHIGLWYDRWPNTFKLDTPCSEDGEFYYDDEGSSYPLYYDLMNTEGDLSKDSMTEDIGAAAQETEEEPISGFNGTHCLLYIGGEGVEDTDENGLITVNHGGWIQVEDFPSTWYDFETPLLWSRANFKMVATTYRACPRGPEWWQDIICQLDEYGGYPAKERCHCITPTTDVWTPIWTKVEESDFYDKYGIGGNSLLSGYDDVPTDNIPYGVGLVAQPAESLVAVIKIGSEAYYVWRVTKETMFLNCRQDVAIPDRPYGFEPSTEVDFADMQALGNGAGFWPLLQPDIYIPTAPPYVLDKEMKTPITMSPFNVINGREITGALRPQPSIDDDGHLPYSSITTGEQYTFPTSIFVLGGRERYLKAVEEIDEWIVYGRVWRHYGYPCDGWEASTRNQR